MRSLGIGFVAAATAAAVGFLIVPALILGAPLEATMGFVQKIFYFHVPVRDRCCSCRRSSARGGSVAYLFKGSEAGDRLAVGRRRAGGAVRPLHAGDRAAVGAQGLGRLVAVGRAADHALLLELILIAYLLARRYGGPARTQAVGGAGAVRAPSTCRSSTRASTSGGPFTRRRRSCRRWTRACGRPFWSAFALILLVWARAADAALAARERARRAGRRCELDAEDTGAA